MKRRVLLVLVSTFLIFSCMSINSFAGREIITSNPIVYAVENGNIYISRNGELFDCDNSVTSVVIPEQVEGVDITYIGGYAFNGCGNLRSITLNSQIEEFHTTQLYTCDRLAEIIIPDDNRNFIFQEGVLYSGDMKNLMAYLPANSKTTYAAPSSVENVYDSAFRQAQNLEYVDLSNCKARFFNYTFEDCRKLKRVSLPDSAHILDKTFMHCSILESVDIGENVEQISNGCFSQCYALTDLDMPGTLKKIGDGAFYECKALEEINIPSGVTDISENAFYCCISMKSISVDDSNMSYKSEDGVLLSKDGKTLVIYPAGKTDERYSVPDSVETIGAEAFSFCKCETLVLPVGIKTIDKNAFNYKAIASLIYPEGIEEISKSILDQDRWHIEEISIPDSVTSIDSACLDVDHTSYVISAYHIKCSSGSYAEAFVNENYPDTFLKTGNKITQKIICDDVNVNYGCKPFLLSFKCGTSSSLVSFESNNNDVASVDSNGLVTVNGPGTAVITLKASETNDYYSASKDINIVVGSDGKIEQDIECETVIRKFVDDDAFNLGATANTSLTYQSGDTSVAEVTDDGTVKINGTGDIRITIWAAADDTYAPAVLQVRLIITKRSQEISGTENSYSLEVYDEIILDPSADTDISYDSSDEDVVTVDSAGNLKAMGEGSAVITVSAKETAIYNGASKRIKIDVKKHGQEILCEYGSIEKKYTDREFNLNAWAETELTYSSNNEKVVTIISDGTVYITGAGEAEITITAEETHEYAKAEKIINVHIANGKQTIKCDDVFTKAYGDSIFNLNASTDTFVQAELSYTSRNDSIVSVDKKGNVTIKKPGTAIIEITAAESTFYDKAVKEVTVTVSKASQEIRCESKIEKKFGDDPFTIEAVTRYATDETVLSFSSDNDDIVMVGHEKGNVTIAGTGEAHITVSASETEFYDSAEKVVTIKVSKADQSIHVADKFNTKVGNSFNLQAIADTPLSYVSSNENIVTVDSKGNVKANNAGTAIISIVAEENDKYAYSIKPVSITISRLKQSIVCTNSFSKVCGTQFALKASAKTGKTYKSSNKSVAVVDKTGKVTVKGPGTAIITITAKQTGKYTSATKKVTVKGKLKKPTLACKALSGHKIKITWSKVYGITGYKLYIYDSKTKKYKCVLTKGASIKSVTHKGLKKGKIYRYKVRAYKKSNGKVFFSQYSVVRKIKAR